MGIRSKSFLAILIFALGCTPALARRATPNSKTMQQDNENNSENQQAPADPASSVRVWTDRGRGSGYAMWGSGMGVANPMGMDVGNALGMAGLRVNSLLAQAQRYLRDPMVQQQLGINDQQASKLEQQLTDFRKTLIQDGANLAVAAIDLQNSVMAQNPDRSTVQGNLQALGNAQMALEKAAVDFVVNLKTEITPAQQQKIRQFLERRRGNFGPRPGAMRGRRRSERRNRRGPGASTYQGSQRPPAGSAAAPQPPNSQEPPNAPEEPNSQGEPQGSTPQTPQQ